MHGVILDFGSLHPEDLDTGPLLGRLESWDLHDAIAPRELHARIGGADVVLCNKTRLDAAALAAAPRLGLVAVMATGTNNIDLEAARARGITVCNAPGYARDSVAEHTLMLILALARRLESYHEAVRAGEWSASAHFCLHRAPLLELRGACLGIVVFGSLGRAVARLAEGFGMQIALAALPGRDGAPAPYPRVPLEELLARADVLTLHCPLSEHTRGLIGAPQLARMKRGALLVNTARGGIVDENALIAALRSGQLGGAAIDTLEHEPPLREAALLQAGIPNLIVTPHIAWASRAARQQLVNQLGDAIVAWRAGNPIDRVV